MGSEHGESWRGLELEPNAEARLTVSGGQEAEGDRRLAAIMFTDTVGFTGLGQKDESLMMDLLEEQRSFLRPQFARFRGREVKTTGDGFLVEFASAQEAVRCAAEIQKTLWEENNRRPDSRKLLVRIGIHLGDVIHLGADVAGDAVNVASRIEPLAPPGGVTISGQVYESVLNKVDLKFNSIGTPALKNVATPIEVYQISGLGRHIPASAQSRAQAKDRIAVLPFVNISQETEEEYFADGLTEELISCVSRTEGLRVIARTSVMKYKGTSKPLSEIGKELGVENVLEGSVRKAAERVRINVQLVDPSVEEPKWSQQYDRELRDIFAIQTDIAQRVADALRLQILGPSGPASHTRSPEAYVSHLRGRQSWNMRTEAGITRAIGFFQKALEEDASFARAYAGLADCYSTLALLEFVPPNEAYPKAKEAVGKALSLDPMLAEAHTSLGLIRFQYDWDWKGAEEEFNEAIRINPSYAPAHHFFADYLKAMGRFDEALAEIEKAKELDPLNLAINTGVGHVLYLSKQYDRAIEQYKKAVDLDPNFTLTHIWFGRPYLEKGMYEEAISELETAVRLSGEGTLALAMLGHGLASSGREGDTQRILDRLLERSKTKYVPSYWVAVIYNGLKDREKVLEWLQKAFEERSSWLVWCNVEPRFDWLRDDPKFSSLMAAMKFP